MTIYVWMRVLQLDLTMGGRRLEAEDGADLSVGITITS